ERLDREELHQLSNAEERRPRRDLSAADAQRRRIDRRLFSRRPTRGRGCDREQPNGALDRPSEPAAERRALLTARHGSLVTTSCSYFLLVGGSSIHAGQ